MARSKKKGDKVSKPLNLLKTLNNDKVIQISNNKLKKNKLKKKLIKDTELVDEKLSFKILNLVKQQQLEETENVKMQESEENELSAGIALSGATVREDVGKAVGATTGATAGTTTGKVSEASNKNENTKEHTASPEDSKTTDHEKYSAEDEKMLNLFMSTDKNKKCTTLDEVIKKKLGILDEAMPDDHGDVHNNLSEVVKKSNLAPELQSLFEHVGIVMSKYRAGKFPKAFRQIPMLRDWEEALWLTKPEKWSSASVMQATKIFASSMSELMAQRYYNLVLLPRVRDDISFYKKLNFHIYEAVMKSVFKPMAFVRGFLLPLCNLGNCSLKEATIICSILRDKSIPSEYASAGMVKIAEMDYNGANSIFLRTLIEKKYALPYRVIDAIVFHFLRFKADKRILPVLWHQCFLSFVNIYGKDLSEDQKRALIFFNKNPKS